MNSTGDSLIVVMDAAFRGRTFPGPRIIKQSVDLTSYECEAARVDRYIRSNKAGSIDRSNSALSAFHYLTPEAALWALPLYMKSLIENFREEDFLIDVVREVLASGNPPSFYDDLGVRMRSLATPQEADAVCQFCRWLRRATGEAGDPTSNAVVTLWCGPAGWREVREAQCDDEGV